MADEFHIKLYTQNLDIRIEARHINFKLILPLAVSLQPTAAELVRRKNPFKHLHLQIKRENWKLN